MGGFLARTTTGDDIVVYPGTVADDARYLTNGSDGAIWFTEHWKDDWAIGRIDMSGTVTHYPLPGVQSLLDIATGSDGALWFTRYSDLSDGAIGRLTTTGQYSSYLIPTYASGPFGITSGPDGALWFTETNQGKIGRITIGGVFTEYNTPGGEHPGPGISSGPDGALWFTYGSIVGLGRVSTTGDITNFSATGDGALLGMASDDTSIWFASYGGYVGRLEVNQPPNLQTASFTSTVPTTPITGGSTYTPTASATSGLTPAITVSPASSSICSISSGTVSFLSAGICVLNANQAGNSAYDPAPQVQQSFIVWSASLLNYSGTIGNDSVYGSTGDDIVISGAGNDAVYGGGGNDFLVGDNLSYTGSPTYYGNWSSFTGNGNDSIYGGDGNDTVFGGDGNDTLNGGDGNDIVYGDAIVNTGLTTGSGNDTITGGAGNDSLYGGAGDDTYTFGIGDGDDTIQDYSHPNFSASVSGGSSDTITFQAGINPSDVTATRVGSDLVLTIAGTSDSITVKSYFATTGFGIGTIEHITFADSTSWDVAMVQSLVLNITGTTGNDTIAGYNTDDIIQAGVGNDFVQGSNGSDIIYGDLGNDFLVGDNISTTATNPSYYGNWSGFSGNGNDTIYGDAGTDSIIGGDGNDTLNGGSGNDTIFGDTTANTGITSGSGNDTISGGTGNDTLNGGAGDDTYIFGIGDGNDTINDYSHPNYSASVSGGSNDTIAFQAGITTSNVTVAKVGYDLVLTITGTSDSITIKNYFYGGVGTIEHVNFANGTSWDVATIQGMI